MAANGPKTEMKAIPQIEKILAEWNPIEVPEDMAQSEYSDYAPRLARLRGDEMATIRELKSILTGSIGLPYDPNNRRQRAEILAVANSICMISAAYSDDS